MGTAGALLQAAGGKALPPTPHTLLQREEQMQIHTHMHTLPKQKKKKAHRQGSVQTVKY